MKKTEPEYYPPVENLLDLIYEHYTENNPVEKNTVAGKAAKAKEKELEEWLRGLEGMDRLVDDYVGDKIPLWEKIMERQGTVCCQTLQHNGIFAEQVHHVGKTVVFRHKGAFAHVFDAANLVANLHGGKIPLWEKIMERQGTVCCTWEKTAFEEGLKVGIRLMMEVYSL